MGCVFDKESKRGLVSLASESREAALRVGTGTAGDPITVGVIRICALQDQFFGNSFDQSKSKKERHVEASSFGGLIGEWLTVNATRLECRRGHEPDVLAPRVVQRVALIGCTAT